MVRQIVGKAEIHGLDRTKPSHEPDTFSNGEYTQSRSSNHGQRLRPAGSRRPGAQARQTKWTFHLLAISFRTVHICTRFLYVCLQIQCHIHVSTWTDRRTDRQTDGQTDGHAAVLCSFSSNFWFQARSYRGANKGNRVWG